MVSYGKLVVSTVVDWAKHKFCDNKFYFYKTSKETVQSSEMLWFYLKFISINMNVSSEDYNWLMHWDFISTWSIKTYLFGQNCQII